MAIAKVLEITSDSTDTFEDAIKTGIAGAAQSVRNIRGAWVKEQQVVVDNGKITSYRVDLKVTFVVD